MRATLKVMRDWTGSQFTFSKTGVMCSRFPVPVTTWASLLMTRWILLMFEIVMSFLVSQFLVLYATFVCSMLHDGACANAANSASN